jgi:hypothetical protein
MRCRKKPFIGTTIQETGSSRATNSKIGALWRRMGCFGSTVNVSVLLICPIQVTSEQCSWNREDNFGVRIHPLIRAIILSDHRSSIIIEAVKAVTENNGNIVAFFYCEHNDQKRRDPSVLLATILHQLAQRLRHPFPPSVVAFLESTSSGDSTSPSSDVSSIPKLGDRICDVAKALGNVFLIIDGLDECEYRDNLFPILGRIASCTHLLITSRDTREIRMSLQEYVSHRISISPSDMQGDIRRFVTGEVHEHHRRGRLLARNPSLLDEIIERLVDGADGM